MRNESAAVLDIRSGEVTFLVGARGVNDTFVRYGNRSEEYEGYSIDGFFDEESFSRAVLSVVSSVRQNYEGKIERVYVGVPSVFSYVKTKGHAVAFPSKRKIGAGEIDFLFDSAFNELMASDVCIRRSAMYFSLGDNHKYFTEKEIYGASTASLQGALCYYFVKPKFYELINALFERLGIKEVRFVPSSLAQAMYLLPQKRREGYEFLLDVGLLSSSFFVVYGDGIVREETFDWGLGYIYALLTENLKVDYETAKELLMNVDVSRRSENNTALADELVSGYSAFSVDQIVKAGLDALCEEVDGFFEKYYRDKRAFVATNSMVVTGEGVGQIRGEFSYISAKLNRITELAYPELPFFDKPKYSSRIALLDMSLGERKIGIFDKIKNVFGGRK